MIFDDRSTLEASRRAWRLLPSDLLPDPALFALISIFSTAVLLQAVVCAGRVAVTIWSAKAVELAEQCLERFG
jgi:hypothetical protein